MRQVAAFSDLSFANRLSQGSFWSQHSFCFYFSAAVCGKVIGSPVYVCLYANTHNVFPPPQPAGSCVDSGWLKCRSKRRPQTLKPALSLTPLCPPHTKLHPLHLSPAFSPLLTASLLLLVSLLSAISPNLHFSPLAKKLIHQSHCQDLMHQWQQSDQFNG